MVWPEIRIITVSSGSHRHGRMHWTDVNLRSRYGALRAYAQSKLANVLFTMWLRRVLAPLPTVAAVAADPGLVDTSLGQKAMSGLARSIWKRRRRSGRPAAEAAASIATLLALPVDELRSAPYWYDAAPLEPARRAYSTSDATRLWELSNRLCGTGDGWALAEGW
jgi:NAD(P)-dependent dehydrogenase (short-subunit alcohol dehydrogenase family)